MTRSLILSLCAGLSISMSNLAIAQDAPSSTPPSQPAGGKLPVASSDDLPRHVYQIEGTPSSLVANGGEAFDQFLAKVRADAESDLAAYDIKDPTTLQGYYQLLQQIAMLQHRTEDALAFTNQIRALEQKESKKLMTGLLLSAIVAAEKASGDNHAAFDGNFRAALNKRLGALPWDVVREEILSAKGRAEIISESLVLGSIKGQLDPVVANAGGELSNDLAKNLVSARMTLAVILPVLPAAADVYSQIIDSHKTAVVDIWGDRNVALAESDKATPVVVAVWDSGVDVDLFPKQTWTNSAETVNGKDDDGNGYVDDVHGIAYDLDAKPVVELLRPLDELRSEKSLVTTNTKGLGDIRANIDSPEASALKKYLRSLKPEEVNAFLEDLNLFGGYSHGTHVAGIASDGNPFVRILPARITFDFRSIPTHTPTIERAKAEAKAARDTVAYFKKAGVRVVNMSWGGSRGDVEAELEKKGWGKDSAERAELARTLFAIQRDALAEAFKSAPEILFIAAAGNADSNNQFEEFIPSGLNLPNLITVGAVDQSGKPTGFTSFGENVHLYANGFEVDSYIPGGQRLKFSGTSMAAPQVANLAGKMLAVNPSLTTVQLIEIMTKSGDPMDGNPDRLLINPKKALELARKSAS
ncbi:MAG: S8 family serine peptidase [Phycisphaeraceae bacterium]|nr:S8 family serine peptidase [Phycisphaeraceae bacterium]